jgi:hypothetical protein
MVKNIRKAGLYRERGSIMSVYLECQECKEVLKLPTASAKLYNLGHYHNDSFQCQKCFSSNFAKVNKEMYEKNRRQRICQSK